MATVLDRSDPAFWQTASAGPAERDRLDAARSLLDAFLAEANEQPGYPWDLKPDRLTAGRAIIAVSPDQQAAVVVAIVGRLTAAVEPATRGAFFYELKALLSMILRRKPPFRQSDIDLMLDALAGSPATWSSWVPVLPVANAIERWHGDRRPSLETRRRLQRLCGSAATRYLHADERKGLETVQRLLAGDGAQEPLIEPNDDWGAAAVGAMEALDPEFALAWQEILEHAATAEAPKPSAVWLKRARELVANAGEEQVSATVAAWLRLLRRPSSGNTRIGTDRHLVPWSLITDRNANLIRGLAWCCSYVDDENLAAALADAALASFTKIPDIGARCTKGGNGCIYALGAMPGMHGAAQLVRLQQRVTYSQALRLIEAALGSAATRIGLGRDDLEDLAVPTFDLVDGRTRHILGAFTAELAAGAEGRVALAWFGVDGQPRKSEPAEVKREHGATLKELKRRAADLEGMLGAQRLRIERFLMTDRSWTLADWRARLLDHPLLSLLVRRLVWSFTTGDETVTGGWLAGQLVGNDDAPLAGLGDETRVRLVHPVALDAETTLNWQHWLERHRVTQPFKQMHREIYRLTDAEREAGTRSARFAGHLLHQHQFAALAKQRGWIYRLQSALFDGGNYPTLALPGDGLRVEFAVDVVEDDASHTAAGIGRYVTTSEFWFVREHGRRLEIVNLADLAPALFSEVLRDLDLFVGVAGVGADPNWRERDGHRWGAYWQAAAFGEVGEAARSRREVLERILPALAIGPRCTLSDRFLDVRGDLRTYRIHLGSGNVLMEPDNAYLCIVAQPWGEGKRAQQPIYLPFEGDGVLSLILSKAILLANDSAITDPTILRQIRPGG